MRSSSPVSPEGPEWSAGGPCEQVEDRVGVPGDGLMFLGMDWCSWGRVGDPEDRVGAPGDGRVFLKTESVFLGTDWCSWGQSRCS